MIHLSDLHIGKRVREASMLEDQAYILEQILRIIEEEAPDAVAIAGDVYDKSVPPAEAVSLFDDFLSRLGALGVPVLLISGNHDSPERLSFGSRLLESSGIHIAPVYGGSVRPVTVKDAYGEVDFWLLPFVKPAHVRRYFPQVESYTDACRAAVEQMGVDESRRNVLVTHQFVTGAQPSESEEISVGGSENVDAAVFDCFDYVALGHIHGPQNVGSGRIRYCGTPLKYSFSEAGHIKSVTVVQLREKGELHLRAVPLQPLRDLRCVRGSFEELSRPEAATADYLHVILTDEEDIPEALGRLRQHCPNILWLSYDNTRTRADHHIDAAEGVRLKSPLELFGELYELQNNRPMSPVQRSHMEALMEQIREESQ